MAELPRRVVIAGGGYIAVEFAGIFHGLGADVTIVHRGEEILRSFDGDVRHHLHAELEKKGIRICCGSEVARIERQGDGTQSVQLRAKIAAGVAGDVDTQFAVTRERIKQIEAEALSKLDRSRRSETPRGALASDALAADCVMYATGRNANTAGMGLREAGVKLDENGGVVVDAWCRSSVANVYAVGDVTHRIALTPVAIREGAAVAANLFNGADTPVDHDAIPSAVFSQPPIGTVGLTQEAAVKKFGSAEIYKTTFRPLKATLSGRDERTLMKLVVEPASQRVAGAHMVGPDAPEIIQGVAIAVKAGLTKRQFDATVGIHPTAAEEFVTLKDKQVDSE